MWAQQNLIETPTGGDPTQPSASTSPAQPPAAVDSTPRLTDQLPASRRWLSICLAAAFLWHGGLLLSGSYGATYDAWIHQFFADHYARGWFSTWETRWYTGFTVTSYPPGSHQLMALLSSVLGLEGAFIVVQLGAVLGLVVGVWRFSRIWVGPTAANWAAALAVVSTSIAEVVHVFGQLPTSFSLALLLNTLPSIYAWTIRGDRRHGLVAVAGLAATTAGHHVTTLFGAVFFVGPVLVTAFLDSFRTPRPEELLPDGRVRATGRISRSNLVPAIARRLRRVGPTVFRGGLISMAALMVLITVVLPYWLWSSSDPIVQIPIPHATRDNFIENSAAGIVFFVVPWGASIVLLPLALLRGAFSRALPQAASVGLLFVLGTGGTTPIPKLLLRSAFDILTLDRFTVWATIGVLPLSGAVVASFVSGRLGRTVTAYFGPRLHRIAGLLGAGALLVAVVLASNFSAFRPLQPDPIDPDPIVSFMEKDQHDRWRYLTLGFGDQMARLSAQTTATTVDGNYHSARRLPELTQRSVERLEGAKFRGVPGIGSLQQFLATPERYHLKFVFSNDVFYDPLLWASGWHRLDRLDNGIVVWEREDVPPIPGAVTSAELPAWQRLLWGILPMSALFTAAVAFTWLALAAPTTRLLHPLERVSDGGLLLRLVDRPLQKLAARDTSTEAREPWGSSLIASARDAVRRAGDPAPVWTRRAQAALLMMSGLAIAALGMIAIVVRPFEPTPEAAVVSYYDDLDFRRFSDAHNRLDPRGRPSFDQFLLELSVDDGLVASYGKLDSVVTTTVSENDETAHVLTELSYLTSISQHEVTLVHELRRWDGDWRLVPEPSDISTTDRQFSRSTSVDYQQQGRRQVTVEQTSFGDVLDRPRTQVLNARTVEHDGFFSVVGEITNLDVDPADLTITATFFDNDDELLATHNAGLVTVHKVLPRETVPFRIDLEEIAGSEDSSDEASGDFHPELFSAPRLSVSDIGRIELATKAVVTGRDLDRDLQASDLRVVEVEDGSHELRGTLWNAGTSTATIPHVLVTLLDDAGEVAWVDHIWVDDAVRPQRFVEFSVALRSEADLSRLDTAIEIHGNGVLDAQDLPFGDAATLVLPSASGFDAAKVTITSFHRQSTA